ncbi:MAG: DUF2892 domain-containing protein [Gammaproteobacteria bacterium]|jgi:hypothetical protein
MNAGKLTFYHHPNVGNVDKIVRYVVGAALIGSILVVAPNQVSWIVLLPLMAIPIVISAIIGWDPIYALFQKLPIPRLYTKVADANQQVTAPYQVKPKAA